MIKEAEVRVVVAEGDPVTRGRSVGRALGDMIERSIGFTFGSARYFGSTGGMTLAEPIVSMASTRAGDGYWMVGADGGVFTFGAARYFGAG